MVGVVLNTIDDALDKGKPGPAHWTVDEVTYLRQVLDEARRAGRPVILTADHGHVLDRGRADGARPAAPGERPVRRPPATALGTPEPARSPCAARASSPCGTDEPAAVRSSPRSTRPSTTRPGSAGYHGGASLAEVVVPVITLLPSDALLPPGWYAYDAVGHAPAWWDATASRDPAAGGIRSGPGLG